MLYLLLLSIFLQVGFSNGANLILIDKKKKHEPVLWLVNRPPRFQSRLRYEGILENVTRHSAKAQQFEDMRSHYFQYPDRHTEYGEMVDALDHYFWGMTRGLALEVGALDGSDTRYSRTFGFEAQFNWSRILIEADPRFREGLLEKSPSAFTVNATVCATPKQVHFVYSRHFAGILEYMTPDFLRRHHNHIYKSLTPYGNVSSIDVTHLRNVTAVGCTPMYHILQEAHIRHINFVVISTEVLLICCKTLKRLLTRIENHIISHFSSAIEHSFHRDDSSTFNLELIYFHIYHDENIPHLRFFDQFAFNFHPCTF